MSDSNDPDPIPTSEPEPEAELQAALGEGDPQRVRALVEAGADIRYKREHGYDALVDAFHGHNVESDPPLLELLALLAELGRHRHQRRRVVTRAEAPRMPIQGP